MANRLPRPLKFRRSSALAGALCALGLWAPVQAGESPTGVEMVRVRYMRPHEPARSQDRNLAPIQTAYLVASGYDLYWGGTDSITRIDRRSGEDRAILPIAGETTRCMLELGDGRLFYCTDQGIAGVWDGVSRSAAWQITLDEPLGASAIEHGGCLLVGSRLGSVWCLDPGSGMVRWKQGIGEVSRELRAPVIRWVPVSDTVMAVVRDQGTVTWLDISPAAYKVQGVAAIGGDRSYVADVPVRVADRILLPVSGADSWFVPAQYQQGAQAVATLPDIQQVPLVCGARAVAGVYWQRDRGLAHWTESGALTQAPMLLSYEPALIVPIRSARCDAQQLDLPALGSAMLRGDFVAMDRKGQFYEGNRPIPSPPMRGIASNVVVLPSQKLGEVDVYFVSTAGWLYRITSVAAR